MTVRALMAATAAASSMFVSVSSWADDGWSGELSLGYQASSGNTRTSSANGKVAVGFENPSYKNALTLQSAFASDQGETTAERYWATEQIDWTVTEHDYIFLTGEWQKDRFAGIEERTSEAAGYGRHVLIGPVHKLDVEIGAGASQLKPADGSDRTNDAVGRASVKYGWKISETSDFEQSVKSEVSSINTYVESVTELDLSIVGNLFAKLSYTVRYNSYVPAGSVNTDTFSAVNLSYKFGGAS